jgi:hypothetical protein
VKSALNTTNRSLQQSREFFEASQRPYVTPGTRDGKVAEFKNSERPFVALFFSNAGSTPALNFTLNLWGSFGSAKGRLEYLHLNRYKVDPPDAVIGFRVTRSTTIPGNSTHVAYLPKERAAALSKDQLEQVRSAKRSFHVLGTYEYCDQFGKYTIANYGAEYSPEVEAFIPSVVPGPGRIRQMSGAVNPELFFTKPGAVVTPLPRCKQPGEQ